MVQNYVYGVTNSARIIRRNFFLKTRQIHKIYYYHKHQPKLS